MSGRDSTGTPRDLLTNPDGQLQTAGYDSVFDKMVVGTARDKFRDEFFTFDTVNNWEVVQTGTNQSLAVDGTTGGARYLRIVTGIDVNQETIILSRKSFKMPFKLAFCLSMSQRIANQEVFVEMVSVNAAGAVETDATFPSTNLNNALNGLSWKFDSTTATSAIYIVRGYGVSELPSGSTAFTVSTAATGTSPNFLPAGIWEINGDMEESVFDTRSVDSVNAIAALQKRTQYIPDSGKDYKIRVRVRNLGTAPASTTDVRLHSVRLLDTTRFTVDFARYMGRSTDASDSLPVVITGAGAVTTPIGQAQAVGNVAAGTAQSGAPVRIGGVAKTAQPTARTDNTVVDPLFDKVGRAVTRSGQVRDLTDFGAQVILTATTETTLVAAVAATFNDLQSVEVASTATFSGAPTGARLDFRDTTTGTVRFSIALPAGGGAFNVNRSWDAAELKQTTVNTNWTVQLVFVGGTTPAIATGDIRITPVSVRNV